MSLKIFLIFFLLISLINFSSADILSLNSGGDNQIVITGGNKLIEGFFFGNLPTSEGPTGNTLPIDSVLVCGLNRTQDFLSSFLDNNKIMANDTELFKFRQEVYSETNNFLPINSINSFLLGCNFKEKPIIIPKKFPFLLVLIISIFSLMTLTYYNRKKMLVILIFEKLKLKGVLNKIK